MYLSGGVSRAGRGFRDRHTSQHWNTLHHKKPCFSGYAQLELQEVNMLYTRSIDVIRSTVRELETTMLRTTTTLSYDSLHKAASMLSCISFFEARYLTKHAAGNLRLNVAHSGYREHESRHRTAFGTIIRHGSNQHTFNIRTAPSS